MTKVFPCGFGKHLWSVTEEQLQCYMDVCRSEPTPPSLPVLSSRPSASPSNADSNNADAPLPRNNVLLAGRPREAVTHRSLPPH